MGSLESLRDSNRSRVIDALRRRGSASRSDLARLTGLSRTTVTTLIADLQDRGLILEEPGDPARPETGSRGRRPAFLRLAPAAGAALGIDFGHRLIRVAVADLASNVLAEQVIELDVDGAACAAFAAAAELTEVVLQEAGIDRSQVIAAGVGIPGPIDHATGSVASSTILPGWSGVSAARELEQLLQIPVRVDNDANLGALGEVTYGAGQGLSDVVYVRLTSGIGSGPDPRRPAAPRRERLRRRARARAGAARGHRLPLRQPRLPRDGRRRRRAARACCALPTATS